MSKNAPVTVSDIFELLRTGNQREGVDLLYKYHYNKMYAIAFSIVKKEDLSQDIVHNVVALITSYKELIDYMNSSRFLGAEKVVINKMESYLPDFFDEKMLVVINLEEETGSSKIFVERIDFADSEAMITLKRQVPDACEDSIKIWSIFIEFDIKEIELADYKFQQ